MSGRFHRPPKAIEDDYEILEKVLGSGMNGVVQEATRKNQSEEKYAIKAFKLFNADRQTKERFESEVQIFLMLDHPHIARLLDVYESEQYIYLVMECMLGGELFDRLIEATRFSEHDAADAVWQMLLALHYLHGHKIVHRDLKLENWLFQTKESNHLRLIDFGFSKMWDPNIKMKYAYGTVGYVAPEVLRKSYTSQCDLWSLGVIAFVLLSGVMPFAGKGDVQTENILAGRYAMTPEKWDKHSKESKDFVKSLLKVNPTKRMTAEAAMEHPWIKDRATSPDIIDESVVDALRQFAKGSKFRRCCMSMMAWSLTYDERNKVRQYFMELDHSKTGTITLAELRDVLVTKFQLPDGEAKQIFEALDSSHDEEVNYTDFLAAMLTQHIELHDDMLQQAFSRFDHDKTGYITVESLKNVLGDSFEGQDVSALLKEADQLNDGRVSYAEFVSYIKGSPLDNHLEAAAKIVDHEVKAHPENYTRIPGLELIRMLSPRNMGRKLSKELKKPIVLPADSASPKNQDETKPVEKTKDAAKPGCCAVQ